MRRGSVEDQFGETSGGIPVSRIMSVRPDGEIDYTYLTHPDQGPEIVEDPGPKIVEEDPPTSGPLGGENRPPRDDDSGWFPDRSH